MRRWATVVDIRASLGVRVGYGGADVRDGDFWGRGQISYKGTIVAAS